MKALIDADILRYEVGAVGEVVNEDGVREMRSFEFVRDLLDSKIEEICDLAWADEKPTLFLTSCKRTHNIVHRKDGVEFVPNFREEVAVTKPYKGTRKGQTPLHYENITAYLINMYDTVVAEGLEADDLLSITQIEAEPNTTIICTRDKDLRMIPGNHFGWACGKQEAYGPRVVTDSEGQLTFCMQLLTGDTVDNIPGVPRVGPVKATDILEGADTFKSMLEAVREAYRAYYGDTWHVHMEEQGQLLWMTRKLVDGKPVRWKVPEEIKNVYC